MKIFVATGAFMVAMVVAMLFSAIRYHRISPLLWFSGIMVVVLGGLTIWLHNETFIKMKPTVYYALVVGPACVWSANRPAAAAARARLDLSRASTRPAGTSSPATGRCSSRSWPCSMRAVWRNSSTSFWVGFKLWGALPLTFLFAAANIPMLLRHGLMKEDADARRTGPVE